MKRNQLLQFAILQILPLLILPPSMFFGTGGVNLGTIGLVATLAVIYGFLGWGLMRGRGWALTLSILLQGLNVIIRLMMIFPNAVSKKGVWDPTLIIFFAISIGLSAWMMFRLDRPDIRSTIIA